MITYKKWNRQLDKMITREVTVPVEEASKSGGSLDKSGSATQQNRSR